jgi:transposase-like protein
MKTEELTQQRPEDKQTVGKLLSPEERGVCKQLAAGEAPWSQRAQALLALDEGATQAEAGSQAGLTQGQVRYWLGRFREDGLSIFPESEKAEATDMKAAGAAEKSKKKKKKKQKKTGKAKKGKKTKAKKKPKKKKTKKAGKSKKAKKAKGTSGRSDKKSKK